MTAQVDEGIKYLKEAGKVTVEPLDWKLISRFEYDGIEREFLSNVSIQETLFLYLERGDALCGLSPDGTILAAAGIIPVWVGVGYVWLFFNLEARNYAEDCLVAIRENMEIIRKARGYHRLQTFVLEQQQKALRFAEKFGFKVEGLMDHFGVNGEKMILMGKVFR